MTQISEAGGKAKEHGVTIRFILEVRGFKEKLI